MGGGLANYNSSCYKNATIQCLAYIPEFTRLLLDNEYFQDMPTDTFQGKFIFLLRLFFNENDEFNNTKANDEKSII